MRGPLHPWVARLYAGWVNLSPEDISCKGQAECRSLAAILKGLGGRVDINVRRRGTVNVLQLKGNLTLGDPVNSFRSAVAELMQAGDSTFVVDLAGVAKMDSSGIGVLVNTLTASRKQGGNVKLVNPSEFARKTLQLVGVLKLFETFDREDAAVESYA